jgi:hypothetical protein
MLTRPVHGVNPHILDVDLTAGVGFGRRRVPQLGRVAWRVSNHKIGIVLANLLKQSRQARGLGWHNGGNLLRSGISPHSRVRARIEVEDRGCQSVRLRSHGQVDGNFPGPAPWTGTPRPASWSMPAHAPHRPVGRTAESGLAGVMALRPFEGKIQPYPWRMGKIGAKIVSHGRYVAFQMAEVALTVERSSAQVAESAKTAR